MTGTAYGAAISGKPTNGTNRYIDSLAGGSRWFDSTSNSSTVTISYALVVGTDPYGAISGQGHVWSNDFTSAITGAMRSWEAVANVRFSETTSANADIWYWSVNNDQIGGSNILGWHDFPAPYNFGEPAYGAFNYQYSAADTTTAGGLMYNTFVHELGHGLGLAHPHDGGYARDATIFPGVKNAFYDYGSYDLNQGIYTVMSYNDGWADVPTPLSGIYGCSIGPMAFDIATVQMMYGANTSYATGNTTYQLPTENAAGTGWNCIWDAGGTDTITNSSSSIGCTINLNAATLIGTYGGGYVSLNSGVVGGYTIANGVTIENATGGDGADTLTGNSAANELIGGAGSDTLLGGLGDDTLSGGSDNDWLTGGLGGDTLTGGLGADRFVFNTTTEISSRSYSDTITDFLHGTDLIDVSIIDANSKAKGNQAFLFSSNGSYKAYSLWFVGGVVYADTNAKAGAEFHLALTSVSVLDKWDFIL